MAKGLVEVTSITSDELAYGEFKLIGNYEKPTEIEIGASRGGCKVNMERSIKEIAFDGSYGAVKGLRRYEKFIISAVINSLYLRYFNQKIIADFESGTGAASKAWTAASGGVYAAETSNVAEGYQAAKATLTSSGDGIHEVFSSAIDLTTFDNGESSDTGDFIGFSIYITTQDLADLGSADLRLSFHMDSYDTETNYYYYDIAASALTADKYTAFKIAKSSFSSAGGGSEDWAAVTGISLKLDAAPSAEVECYIDKVSLIQDQSNSAIVPVNGGGCSFTDEGDYREFSPNLEIQDNEYYENIAIVGQYHEGTAFIILIYNVLNDGNISLGMTEKDEIVNETTFKGHYKHTDNDGVPCKIRIYKAA